MLLFFISCFSFILVFKSSCVKPFLLRLSDMRMGLISPMLWLELSNSLVTCIRKWGFLFGVSNVSFLRSVIINPENDDVIDMEKMGEMTLLDLPELALDSILERLTPVELHSMSGVCTYLRQKCRSDHIWEKHLERKWRGVIGNAVCREWQWHMASNKRNYSLKDGKHGGILGVWPFTLMWTNSEGRNEFKGCPPPDSKMAWYLSLESGKLRFPAQVYNRENGHAGFMLSCYDAVLSYNLKTNTFQARYTPHGRHTVEENISWSRLRAPPVDTPPYALHVSDCLDELKPGDHFEIQWRRNRTYPYGWWYGVVGHMDSCSGPENHCICRHSDAVSLEFNQYALNSRWRKVVINRTNHREKGNEADGYYGGIRKLYTQNEISIWKSLWPTRVLD